MFFLNLKSPLIQDLCFSHTSLEHLMKLSMEELVEFLQETLSKDFFYDDDFVIEQLQISMAELKRAKLDLPEPGKTYLDTSRLYLNSDRITNNPGPF